MAINSPLLSLHDFPHEETHKATSWIIMIRPQPPRPRSRSCHIQPRDPPHPTPMYTAHVFLSIVGQSLAILFNSPGLYFYSPCNVSPYEHRLFLSPFPHPHTIPFHIPIVITSRPSPILSPIVPSSYPNTPHVLCSLVSFLSLAAICPSV